MLNPFRGCGAPVTADRLAISRMGTSMHDGHPGNEIVAGTNYLMRANP